MAQMSYLWIFAYPAVVPMGASHHLARGHSSVCDVFFFREQEPSHLGREVALGGGLGFVLGNETCNRATAGIFRKIAIRRVWIFAS